MTEDLPNRPQKDKSILQPTCTIKENTNPPTTQPSPLLDSKSKVGFEVAQLPTREPMRSTITTTSKALCGQKLPRPSARLLGITLNLGLELLLNIVKPRAIKELVSPVVQGGLTLVASS